MTGPFFNSAEVLQWHLSISALALLPEFCHNECAKQGAQMRTQITTYEIAEAYGKVHRDVMRALRGLCSDEKFLWEMFPEGTHTIRGKKFKHYSMGLDGFLFLSSLNFLSKWDAAKIKAEILDQFQAPYELVLVPSSRGEDEFFRMLSLFFPDEKIHRQFPLNGSKIDFYLQESDIFIEYDEPHHDWKFSRKKDESRWGSCVKYLRSIEDSQPWLVRVKQGHEIYGLRLISSVMSIKCAQMLLPKYEPDDRILSTDHPQHRYPK